MHNYYPILWVGAIIGVISTLLIVAAFVVKDGEKETGFERNMKDSEIMQRLMDYAKPFYRQFIVVGFLMLFSIAYDIISPLIVGKIEELVVGKFSLNTLFLWVAGYAAILLVSMACTYFQAVILQKTGQKIISNMREDLFVHIERLSHEQLNEIPVGKLVTRTTNDTNAISLMFTNLLVNLLKNFFVIIGILIAMLFLNYELTLMVLCFVPFIMLFSIIFRKFSRRAHRKVKDCTTDINTYLSENLSGMKITQIFNREDAKMREFTDKSNALGLLIFLKRLITGISCGSFNPQVRGLIFAVDKFLSVSEKLLFVVGEFIFVSEKFIFAVGEFISVVGKFLYAISDM